MRKLKIADLFCGAGGLSHSFFKKGHSISFAIDKDKYSIETFKRNHQSKNGFFICGNIEDIFNDQNYNKILNEKYDLVMGGPPCQGFSTANRQNIKDDPRNKLYKYFLKFVQKSQPNYVLIENVIGIKNISSNIISDLSELGYYADFKIIQASDYGIPQNRKRVFFFGVNNKLGEMIDVQNFFKNLKNKTKEKPFLLKDAIYGLRSLEPHPKKNDTKNEIQLSGFNIEKINDFKNNDYLKLINYSQIPDRIYNHKARYNNQRDIQIFNTLPQGADSTHDSIRLIMPYKRRDKIFKDKYFKLSNNKICKTITSHMKFDCNMYIHPTQGRGLTPREAARVQSFPDNFFFEGPITKCYMQIGNAVPPLLSRMLCESLEELKLS